MQGIAWLWGINGWRSTMKRRAREISKTTMPQRLFVIIAIAFVIGGMAALAIRERARDAETPVDGQTSAVGGPFSLISHEGKRVSEKDFRGRYMLVAFGYTYCPDICPTELQVISGALDRLGAASDKIVPIFISVDPQRDTVEQMRSYVKHFHSKIVGLTGTENEVKAAARAYRVYYRKEEAASGASGADYAVSHSTFIYLMSPNGDYITHFNYGITEEQMVAKLKKTIKG